MTSLPQSKNDRFPKDQTNPMSALGHRLPLQLVQAIQAELYEKVFKWLKDNGEPDEVVEAVDLANALMIYGKQIETDTLSDFSAAELPNDLAAASNLAIKFGGDFFSWRGEESQIPNWIEASTDQLTGWKN